MPADVSPTRPPPIPLLLAGMVLSQLTNAMVNVAVPTMLADLGVGVERAGWIILAYLLPVAVLMPTWGAAGDLFGRQRVFGVGLLIFAAGAALSSVAGSLPVLLAGQALQASGASALNPNGTALIGNAGGARQRGRHLGRQRMILSLAGILGAPLGGLVVQALGWHAVFAAAPAGAIAVFLLLRRSGAAPTPAGRPARFDAPGAVAITGTVLALLAALSLGQELGWLSLPVLGLVGLTAAGAVAIGLVEARQPWPLVPPALLRQPVYVAVLITGLLQAIACFGTMLLGPLLLQRVFALEPAQTGWLLASFPLGMAASGIPGGRLTDRFSGPRVTAASLVGVTAGLLVLRAAATTMQPLLYVPGALLTGFMAGVGLTAMAAIVLHISGEERRGVAMGVFTMVSIMGDAVGVALFPVLLAGHTGEALAAAFGTVYLAAAAVALAALAPTIFMRGEAPSAVAKAAAHDP
ncbi:MAG: MFS transporter [Chloroflexi bacterium]|nr:MFS transporter [Chloroflexota bacterium]